MLKRNLFVFVLGTTLGVSAFGCSGSSSGGGFKEEKQVNKSRIEKNNAKEAKKEEEAPTSFIGSVALDPKYDKASNTLTVTLNLKKGFHAYAAGEEIGMPVKMTVAQTGGWKVEGEPNIPAGKKKDLGELGTSMILEGNVPVTAKVVGGEGPIEGEMKVQVCTEKACDRPRTHKFKI